MERKTYEDPTPLTIDQYFERIVKNADTPEKRLMVAVLKNAVKEYARLSPSSKNMVRRLRLHSIDRYFSSEDRSSLFSFGSICDVFGIDTTYFMERLEEIRGDKKRIKDLEHKFKDL